MIMIDKVAELLRTLAGVFKEAFTKEHSGIDVFLSFKFGDNHIWTMQIPEDHIICVIGVVSGCLVKDLQRADMLRHLPSDIELVTPHPESGKLHSLNKETGQIDPLSWGGSSKGMPN
jgi:hypothetical protein